MAGTITLKDGTFLYDKETVTEYLASLGFDPEGGFLDLCNLIEPDYDPYDFKHSEPEGDNWEAIADGYYNAYQNICIEIQAKCKEFLSGRKLTKAKFVDWLLDFMEDGILNY